MAREKRTFGDMKNLYPFYSMFFIAIFCVPFLGVAEDLDAALEAQKKKSVRRVYSERAHITDLNIAVPKTLSEEEKSLDRDLRRMEDEMDRQEPSMGGMRMPRRAVSGARKPKNWLTPELMDGENEDSLTDEGDSGWIVQELERQDAIRFQNAEIEKEAAHLEKQLAEDARQLEQYNEANSPTFSPIKQNPAAHFNSRTQSGVFLQKKNGGDLQRRSSVLSPIRRNSGVIESSFSSKNPAVSPSTSRQTDFRRPAQKVSNTFSPRVSEKKAEYVSPLKRVRRSSPIHRKDPFVDDFMPEFKSSIWD